MKGKNTVLLVVFAVFFTMFVSLLSYNITFRTHLFNDEQLDIICTFTSSHASCRVNDGINEDINSGITNKVLDNFTSREKEHIADVKNVMNRMDMLFSLLAILVTILSVILYNKEVLGKGLFWGGVMGMMFTILVILMGVFNFDELFSRFHLLFFAPGSWIFSPEDRLIQLFPITLFIRMTKSILINAALLNLLSVTAGLVMWRHHK